MGLVTQSLILYERRHSDQLTQLSKALFRVYLSCLGNKALRGEINRFVDIHFEL